jgi:4-hydroxybenzoate polyprenyltransferase
VPPRRPNLATTDAPIGFTAELRRQFVLYARLMRLHRPIGTWLLLWPTLWALWIAGDGRPDPQVFLVFVLGVIVMRSAGCVINDFADRKLDPHVERTRNRPLATGEVAPTEALILFLALALLAIALLLALNVLTRWLALLTVVYPFTKRFFIAPQLVLGAAFGWGVPMAFAAQTGAVPQLAWLMWLTAMVWTLVYDTLYGMADRIADEKLGMKSTAISFGRFDLFCVALLQVMMLLGLALIGRAAGLGAWYYGSIAIAAALFLHQRLSVSDRDPAHCFDAFLANRHVGATIFAGIVLDYTFRAV